MATERETTLSEQNTKLLDLLAAEKKEKQTLMLTHPNGTDGKDSSIPKRQPLTIETNLLYSRGYEYE